MRRDEDVLEEERGLDSSLDLSHHHAMPYLVLVRVDQLSNASTARGGEEEVGHSQFSRASHPSFDQFE